MRPLALPLCFLLIAAAADAPNVRAQRRPAAAWVADARIDRLERWLKAVARHEPGSEDQEAIEVGSWPQGDLQTLWIDVDVLVKLMRNPGATVILNGSAPPAHAAADPLLEDAASQAQSAGVRSRRPCGFPSLCRARRRPISMRTCGAWRRSRSPPGPAATATTTSCAAARCSTPTWPCWSSPVPSSRHRHLRHRVRSGSRCRSTMAARPISARSPCTGKSPGWCSTT